MGRAKAIIAIVAAAGLVACQPTTSKHADSSVASTGASSAAGSVASSGASALGS